MGKYHNSDNFFASWKCHFYEDLQYFDYRKNLNAKFYRLWYQNLLEDKKNLGDVRDHKIGIKILRDGLSFLNEWSKVLLGKATFFRWTIIWLIFALFESSHKISFSFRKCGKSKRDLNTETVEKMDEENSLFLVYKINLIIIWYFYI